MKYFLSALGVFLFLLVVVPAIAYSPIQHGPRIVLKNGASTNWAGYAALTSLTNPQRNAVSDVKGNWTIPTMDCSASTASSYSSTWVGMDGYSNGTVEQTGTEQDCINGQAQYYAWYEMYPKPSYRVPLTIHVNDAITGEVHFNGSAFVLTLNNTTSGKSFSTTQRSNKAQRQSAEWITEAPSSGGVLPLANFGTISQINSLVNNLQVGGSGLATDKIDMVTSDGLTTKASTSALTSNTDFTVTWQHQ